ncbi:MAG: amino acid--[acyl-carrier-protein] ligase, partial [Gemmatimonadaceae bacterium]
MTVPKVSIPSTASPFDAILRPSGTPGVHARTELFETVMHGLDGLITRRREPDAEALSFPPVMSRAHLERSGYLKSFPHLLGCVSGLHGTEAEVRSLVERRSEREWTDALQATDMVLTPAACYPLYPIVADNGSVPGTGATYDVQSYCFRHEASAEPGRVQAFRMREIVCVGLPDAVQGFRQRWIDRATRLMGELELPGRIAPASDPFFGRVGRIMALDQVERALKFELLISLTPGEADTACMSF